MSIVVSGKELAWPALSVTKPQEESPDAAQEKSTSKKPACPRQSEQAHHKHTDHNNQPDWVAREKTCTVTPEWNDFGWAGFGAMRGAH
jgi:hypothetical protein